MTFKLPSGVTGLTKSTSDHRAFTKWVHATARIMDFKPLGVETRDLYCTFDVFELNHDYQPPLWLLHNRFFPLVGASQSLPVIGDAVAVEADFIPVPNAEQAVHLGLQPLSDALLNEPLVVEHWASLSAIEVRLAKYFKPHTVGQVIFNYWDQPIETLTVQWPEMRTGDAPQARPPLPFISYKIELTPEIQANGNYRHITTTLLTAPASAR